jgi:formylglycine-generating enzyme required for sulfatase activity
VSWYESLAFCAWLSEVSGEDIRLVSDKQWQRAAQGSKRFTYPWGMAWDATRCNHGSDGTTPVSYYEGRGESPYGVVDMVGNVWEWCLTEYVFDDPEENKSDGQSCMLRGGSWANADPETFSVTQRNGWLMASGRNEHVGFRCVRIDAE